MRYLGGKHRQGPIIAGYIKPYLGQGKPFIEPFCGAMGSACQVAAIATTLSTPQELVLSDNNLALVNMWHACLDGWLPPEVITEEMYTALKQGARDPSDPMTAAVGFGMAFAGKFFATFARDPKGKTDFAKNLRNLLAKRVSMLKQAGVGPGDVFHCEYSTYADMKGGIFYLDPPYANRTGQTNAAFDSVGFWNFARQLSQNNVVFVTEFIAPEDFVAVHNFGDTVNRHREGKGSDGTNECIFILEGKDYAKPIERPVSTIPGLKRPMARTKAQSTGKKYASVSELIADLSPEAQAEFARLRAVEECGVTRTTDARGVTTVSVNGREVVKCSTHDSRLSPELLAELEEDRARFREDATAQAD